jgi:hypothetical protein
VSRKPRIGKFLLEGLKSVWETVDITRKYNIAIIVEYLGTSISRYLSLEKQLSF